MICLTIYVLRKYIIYFLLIYLFIYLIRLSIMILIIYFILIYFLFVCFDILHDIIYVILMLIYEELAYISSKFLFCFVYLIYIFLEILRFIRILNYDADFKYVIDIFNYFGFVKAYSPYRKKVMDIISFFCQTLIILSHNYL